MITLRTYLSLASLVLIANACDLGFDPQQKATFRCQAAADCDGLTGAAGYLCLDGKCDECGADWQCSKTPHYGQNARCVSGRCVIDQQAREQRAACAAGIEACPCFVDGTCNRGLLCDRDSAVCRKPKTCADIPCDGACIPGASDKDASCAKDCASGELWDEARGLCVTPGATCDASAAYNLVAECAARGRSCDAGSAGGAGCGECLAGYVATGAACTAQVACAELDCAAQHRGCAEEPNGHCTDCVAGYRAASDGAACLPTCAALSCRAGEVCLEQDGDAPARCAKVTGSCPAVPACGENQAWNPMWQQCQDCGALDCVEDERRTGEIFPLVTNQFRCVCASKPGYYFDSATLRTEPCDADGDGWVRRSAWDALAREADCTLLGDPDCDCALRDNALCELMSIDRVVLHNVYGETETIALAADDLTRYVLEDGTLPLFETDTNDDLSLRSARQALPAYATGLADKATARTLRADEINSFTKACVDAAADFNGNQQSDLTEYQGAPKILGPEWLLPFTHFSYFVELYDGWYEPNAADARRPGSYHLREKARRAGDGEGTQLPLFAAATQEYAQSCHRMRDQDFAPVSGESRPNTGMDFARYNAPGAIARFGHHSQFKCVELASSYGPTPRRQAPEVVRLGSDAAALYDLTSCSLAEGAALDAMSCRDTPATSLAPGMVAFGRARYFHYPSHGGYLRGCVNECAEQAAVTLAGAALPSCPVDERHGCDGDPDHFGRYVCGCSATYTGADCATPCSRWYIDADGDGFGDERSKTPVQCQAPNEQYTVTGEVGGPFDCDDTRADRYPSAPELCNNLDDDCDGEVDEGLDQDGDGDGHFSMSSCSVLGDDCDDNNAAVHPGAEELCDNLDNNCDGRVDETYPGRGASCTGAGVCWHQASMRCAADKRSLTCVQSGASEAFSAQPGSGRDGPTWDWNCDGRDEPEYAPDPADSEWQGVALGSAMKTAWDRTCSPPYEGPATYLDVGAYCQAIDAAPGFPEILGESTEARMARRHAEVWRRCQLTHRFSTTHGLDLQCGDNLLEIFCVMAETGCIARGQPSVVAGRLIESAEEILQGRFGMCLCEGEQNQLCWPGVFGRDCYTEEYTPERDCGNAHRAFEDVATVLEFYTEARNNLALLDLVQRCR